MKKLMRKSAAKIISRRLIRRAIMLMAICNYDGVKTIIIAIAVTLLINYIDKKTSKYLYFDSVEELKVYMLHNDVAKGTYLVVKSK